MTQELKQCSLNLHVLFNRFTNNALEMDGIQFAKLCKDTHMLDSRFNSTDVDLLFARIKDESAQKITLT